MRSDHSKLAPILFDFVPKDRTREAVAMYKILRLMARKNRAENYNLVCDAMRNLMLYGKGQYQVKWVKNTGKQP